MFPILLFRTALHGPFCPYVALLKGQDWSSSKQWACLQGSVGGIRCATGVPRGELVTEFWRRRGLLLGHFLLLSSTRCKRSCLLWYTLDLRPGAFSSTPLRSTALVVFPLLLEGNFIFRTDCSGRTHRMCEIQSEIAWKLLAGVRSPCLSSVIQGKLETLLCFYIFL